MGDFYFFKAPTNWAGPDMARALRKSPTLSERILWNELRGRKLAGKKFRRQVPVGPYVVDFYCHELNLVVEVDGNAHDDQQEEDAVRQTYLEGVGLKVLRVAAEDVERFLPSVRARILRAIGEPPSERS